MITLGVDFASQSKNTAACFVLWKKGRAEVGGPRVTDEELLQLFTRANKVGMDVLWLAYGVR
jgi:predicted nuclease with RNAse H fold